MNQDANACNYGTAIGVIAFIAAIGFLLVDALYEQISSVQNRKYLTMMDLAFSGEFKCHTLPVEIYYF